MKRNILLTVFAMALLVSQSFGASLTVSPTATYQSPITVQTDNNMSLSVARVNGTYDYFENGAGWNLQQKADIKISGDTGLGVLITVPPTVTLTSGVTTATMDVDGRCNSGSYPVNHLGGSACTGTWTISGGAVYLSAFPTGLHLPPLDSGGTYKGVMTVSIDYP